ncbi:carboxylesterase/lipase family protein [Variovorax sp. GB1P17]|uniref:carboxylesterase/lipase family protein n=1 Tax=Variovorax sp. GB1P17 TaxID=3443740 RepID=UPI003F445415
MNSTETTESQGPASARTTKAAAIAMAVTACVALSACGGGSSGSGFIPLPPPAAVAPPPPAPPADGPMVRQTAAGKIEGVDDSANSGSYFWKGVPFAQAPVGDLRWRAPVEPVAWSDTRKADKFGNACLQMGRIYGPGTNNTYDATIGTTLNTPVGSEDCLTLNIWRPASTDKNLPVLLFLYGGSNISGYTADPVYDGAKLAKTTNAVVVTANYRVGILGYLAIPQLRTGSTAGDDSGNFTMLDNMAALRYIQKNIAVFGGDPGNVTLSGQSAGGTNVLALLASPMAKGLFHKALPISAGLSLQSNLTAGLPTLSPESTALTQGQNILKTLVVVDGKASNATAASYIAAQPPAQIAAYLRGQDANKLLANVLAAGLNSAGPIPDGKVLPADPIHEIGAGNYNKVPLLLGFTRDEGKLFAPLLASLPPGSKPGHAISDAARFSMMMSFKPDEPTPLTVADIIDSSYLPITAPGTGFNAKTALITQLLGDPSRVNLLDTLKLQQPNSVWHYRFDWAQEPAPWNDVYGAAHAFDLGFMFGNFGPSLFSSVVNSTANKPGRVALSNAMMASIGAFMRKGDPNTPELGTTWAPWPATLRYDATLTETRITTTP